jgi:hypothetical protein
VPKQSSKPFSLVGASYRSQSPNASSQSTMNWYPEVIEDEQSGVSTVALYPTPGTAVFINKGNKTRGSVPYKGRMFFTSDDTLYEGFANGTATALGPVGNDGNPVSYAPGGDQIAVCSAGLLYVLTVSTSTLSAAVAVGLPIISYIDFCDGYFVALVADSNQFQISSLFDAATWDPIDKGVVSVFAGNVKALKVDHREIWLLGDLASTVYYDSGNANFPFEVNPSAGVIEQGIAAPLSLVKLDNTLFWIGSNAPGSAMVWRAAGYTPQRVSNHALEFAMQMYARNSTIADAVGYAYQDQGHTFYVLYFPSVDKTWVYDVATQKWCERGFWNAARGIFNAHHSWNHVFAFGKHLVGDWNSGNIYDMSIVLPTDANDTLIRRVRQSGFITANQLMVFHSEVQVYLEAGLGPQPPLKGPSGEDRGPEINLRWTDDGGHTFSNIATTGAGRAGEYSYRSIWSQLGSGRNRAYEISVTDPIPWRMIQGIATFEVGTG